MRRASAGRATPAGSVVALGRATRRAFPSSSRGRSRSTPRAARRGPRTGRRARRTPPRASRRRRRAAAGRRCATSIDAACFAKTTGCRSGSTSTAVPIVARSVAAGDQRERDQGVEVRRVGRPGRAAVVGERVRDSIASGSTMWSLTQSESNPACLQLRRHRGIPTLEREAARCSGRGRRCAWTSHASRAVLGGQARIRCTVGRRAGPGRHLEGSALVFEQRPNVRVPNSEAAGTAA